MALLLALNAILHGLIVARFGLRSNMPVFVFMLVYAALAMAVYLAVPYALWAVLILSLVGIAGLTATFNKIPSDKRLEMVIWPLDAVIILYAGYLLFLA